MVNKKIVITLLCAILLFLIGCSSKQVKIVKNGSFQEYPQLKIGKFLENVKEITKSEWQYIETPKGEKVVEYRGKINTENYELLNNMYNIYVLIQFTFDAEGKEFYAGYSSYLLEGINLDKNQLFEITNSKEQYERTKNELKYILQAAYNDNFEFLSDLNKELLTRGLKLALNNNSIKDIELLKKYGLDINIHGKYKSSYGYDYGDGANYSNYVDGAFEKAIKEASIEKLTLLQKIGFDTNSDSAKNTIKECLKTSTPSANDLKSLIFVVENNLSNIKLLTEYKLSQYFKLAISSKSNENIIFLSKNGYDISSKNARKSILKLLAHYIQNSKDGSLEIIKFISETNLINIKKIVFCDIEDNKIHEYFQFPLEVKRIYSGYSSNFVMDEYDLATFEYLISIGATSINADYLKSNSKFLNDDKNIPESEDDKNRFYKVKDLMKQLVLVSREDVIKDYETKGGLYEFN
jgi:hypothetical protein